MIDVISFKPGDTIRVYQKIKDLPAGKAGGDKEHSQIFEGVVLGIRGRGINKTFTVRKLVEGIAVERLWPVSSPLLQKIVVKAKPKKRVRRAKLYYLRQV